MRRALVALAAVVAAWTSAGITAHATYGARVTADEPQYLLSAISIGEDGDLDISDEIAREAYRPFHRVDLDPQTVALGEAGRHVSPHDPLLPALLAGPMLVGGWVAAKATLAILAGLLAAATAWVAVRRFGVRPVVAFPVVGVFACTAPLATYATQVYPEIPAALAVVLAVAALTGPRDARRLALLVVAVVALPWLSVKYSGVAASLAVLGLWRVRDKRRLAAATAVAFATAGAVYLLVHRVLYGGWTAYASGDFFAQNGELSVVGTQPDYVGRARRLVGLLVDDGFGLAAWMVGWLALPFALGALARRRPPHWTALAVPLAAGWLTATFVALTMHGWWWPGRQLVAVLPLGVVAIAMVVDRSSHLRRLGIVAAVLGAGTWWWTTADAAARRHVLVVDFDRTANPWMRTWRLFLPDGRTATALDEALLGAWGLAVVVLGLWGWWWEARRPAPTPEAAIPCPVVPPAHKVDLTANP